MPWIELSCSNYSNKTGFTVELFLSISGPCLTPECIQVAASLLSAMDRTVDLCSAVKFRIIFLTITGPCLTPECIQVAASLLSALDTTVLFKLQ